MCSLQGLKVTTFKTMNENTGFFRGMTSSWYCRLSGFQQKALPISQGCHLEADTRTATTSPTRWCHSLRKKERRKERVREEDKRRTGEGRGCEREKTGRQDKREGEKVMSCFQSWLSGSWSAVFVWTSHLNCGTTLQICMTDTTDALAWYSW